MEALDLLSLLYFGVSISVEDEHSDVRDPFLRFLLVSNKNCLLFFAFSFISLFSKLDFSIVKFIISSEHFSKFFSAGPIQLRVLLFSVEFSFRPKLRTSVLGTECRFMIGSNQMFLIRIESLKFLKRRVEVSISAP